MGEEIEVERWRRTLLTSPDEQFFQIMRIYLGDIKTPFNKHDLIRSLTALLRNPETIDRIVSLIDSADARILTGITMLDEPTMSRLYALFEDSIGYLALHYHVLNLEERMLVYRDDSDERMRIRVHPLLAEQLAARIVEPTSVFRMTPCEPVTVYLSHPSDARIIAAATYVATAGPITKSDGELRKRASLEIESVFAEDLPIVSSDTVLFMANGLERLGILHELESGYRLHVSRWRDFCRLDADSRIAYLVTHAVAKDQDRMSFESTIRSILEQLPSRSSIEITSLHRLIRACSPTDLPPALIDRIIETLVTIGVMSRVSKEELVVTVPYAIEQRGETPRGGSTTASDKVLGDSERDRRPILQPTFELHVPVSISARSAWFIPLIAELKSYDTISHYEITRAGCARAYDAGFDAEMLIDLLDDLCGKPVPSNIRTSLLLWEQEFRGIRMARGTVILVDESRKHLFEYDARLQELIHETLHPGVYLVRSRDIEALRRRLEQVGIDPLPEIVDIDSMGEPTDRPEKSMAPVSSVPELSRFFKTTPPAGADSKNVVRTNSVIQERYRAEVESYPGVRDLTAAERVELDERIERRLILFPKQIEAVKLLTEIVEAKGFDYLGKVRLIEQTISHGGDLLEITRIDSDGKPVRSVIKPDSLNHEGSELILVGRHVSEEKKVRHRVRTMGVVRRRRGSMLR